MDQEAPEVLEGLEGLEDHAAGHTNSSQVHVAGGEVLGALIFNKSSSRMCGSCAHKDVCE